MDILTKTAPRPPLTAAKDNQPSVRTDVPPGWGQDDLSAYLHGAHRNRVATFVQKRAAYDRLAQIDKCFVTVAKDWLNPPDVLSPTLFLRAHAAYRAACDNALAGQAGELYGQLRAVLERAGYGLLIGKKPALGQVWLDRHKDDAGMKASKREFGLGTILDCLKPLDGAGAKRFEDFYQVTIDFGGHPNERAVTGNLQIRETEHRKEFLQVYMHADGVALDHGLKATAQVGVCALETMQNLYGPRYELLGVRAAILDLRRGL
jgi:hypothetical protein